MQDKNKQSIELKKVNGKWVERPLSEEEVAESLKKLEEIDHRYGRPRRVVKQGIERGLFSATPEVREEYAKMTFPPDDEQK